MTRKVALTGIMIFFRPGSVQQLLVGGTIASFYMAAAATKRPFVSRFDNNFKIATDGAIIVTFNIAVVLNDRVDLSKELLSEDLLNFCLVVVNILIPACVVSEQIYQNKKKSGPTSPTTKAEEESGVTVNPLGANGAAD